MNSVLGVVFASIPFVIVALVTLAFVGYAGLTLAMPRLLLYPYLGILFWVTEGGFGRLDAVAIPIWHRGSGVLYIPLLLWLLLAAMLWAQLSAALERRGPVQCNLLPWFIGWILLLAGHICVGLLLEIPLAEIVGTAGFANIAWMAVLIMTIQLGIRNQRELAELSKLIVLVGLARALFGLVRWVAFGGDPANAYANYDRLDLKLTFFEINDNLVCWIALCIAAVQLLRPGQTGPSRLWRFVLWTTVAAGIICIILSFRRTVWIGVVIGGAFLLLQLPVRRRLQAAFLGGPIVLAGIVYSAWKRLSQTKGAGGLDAFLFDIQSKSIGAESARLLELKLAWADFVEHPIFGIGSWGRYKGHELISWQADAYGGTWVHSGILHIALHSGLVGLALTVGLGTAFVRFWLKNKSAIDQSAQPLAIAGVAGALFMIPDLLIGTPIPQVRTMQMIAFCLSLPYVAYGASRHTQRDTAATSITTFGARSSRVGTA